MQIKRYKGETIQDAIFKVKADLGPEAVIIDRREYKEGGFFGFFAKTKVEILAAVESKTAAVNPDNINPIKEFINEVKNTDNPESTKGKNLDIRDQDESFEFKIHRKLSDQKKYQSQNEVEIKNEAQNERQDSSQALRHGQAKKSKKSAKAALAEKIKSVQKSNNSISAADNNLYNYLLDQGVESRFITKFIKELETELVQNEDLKEKLPEFCQQYFDFNSGIEVAGKQKVVSFIGPTGVGKTTNVAKIAAIFSMEKNKKVGFITADTYRIAAVEQLQTYSDIIDLPFAVSYSGENLKDLIDSRFADCDLVLIDTPGSSWKDELQLARLKMYTEADFIDECQLVISLNTKSSDLKRIINKFSIFNPDHLFLTKLDETESYGDLINLKENYGLPFSYLSFGQDVPEDIEVAQAANIRKYLFGDYYA
ncbi:MULTISPECIES: flagellar biosynthesis protein FlhF [Halanaerobium]|jgi:flagellar biosynthesis protein FlhF|uniref:Flagellar biosynthesis protein FlhF n=1 Tax=Halanaerobium congolense TaxID=54121 RepID=A0A4R8GLH9_9FIRM|nr:MULTISPECIES: flagellar biosynthesis protein FlhF [Halanaerobium]PUU92499.1 MAG: Flagellar biosynthesis protein FlhF [Halanaerobium sp.]TDS34714.1 flagellar biosynthesis protein FlhF [Halanaerobium congolense]TDX42357.1 flagellar biosynthesis protein FlhF [Halanaerobium congolense]